MQKNKIQVMSDDETLKNIKKVSEKLKLIISAFCRMAIIKELIKVEAIKE